MNEGMKNLKEIEDLHKEIEYLKKQISLLQDNHNIELMDKDRRIADLMNINDSHAQTNGDLRMLNNQLLRENDKMKEVINKTVDKLRKNGEI
tara:strand:+ start:831 stop:1106 length:276 start_codon:yes stop_codon:yes gene_type:complete